MNKQIMNQFYTKMLEGNNFETANSLRIMLDDLSYCRVERIVDTFKIDMKPFRNIGNYKNWDAYFCDCFWGEAHLGIDIVMNPDSSLFLFWDRRHISEQPKEDSAKLALEKMGIFGEFSLNEDGIKYRREAFAFPVMEKELYSYIVEFKRKLCQLLEKTAPR